MLKAEPTVCASFPYKRKGNEEAPWFGKLEAWSSANKTIAMLISLLGCGSESLAFYLGHTTLMVLFLNINKLKKSSFRLNKLKRAVLEKLSRK